MRFWVGFTFSCLLSHFGMAQFPIEYQSIPQETRSQATVIFVGIYFTATGTHQQLPDGTIRWRVTSGFRVLTDYSGNIANERIEISSFLKKENPWIATELEEGEMYLVLLKPQAESMETVKDKDKSFSHLNLVPEADILAIVQIVL